jgi:hypothetical protein
VASQGADWANKLKPCARSGHSAVFFPAERGNMGSADQLVLFGGFAFGKVSATGDFVPSSAFQGYADVVASTRDLHYVNEVHALNLQTSTWARMEVEPAAGAAEAAPCARQCHSATLVGSRMWIFGGRTLGGRTLDDVWFLDLGDWMAPRWHRVDLPREFSPARRAMHAAALVGGGGEGSQIMVMGGRDEDGALLEDMWLLDVDRALALEEQGVSAVLLRVMRQAVWSQPHAVGQCPTGMAGHALSLLPGGGSVLVLGAERQAVLEATGKSSARLGAWELDLATMIWARANAPPFSGDVPHWVPRSALAVSGRICVVFGGEGVLALLDLGTREWMDPRIVGEVPRPRLGHSATVVDSRVVCFGGYFEDSSKPCDDLVVFEM